MLLYSSLLYCSLLHVLTDAATGEDRICKSRPVVLTRTLVREPEFPAGIVIKREVTYSYWPEFKELPQGALDSNSGPLNAAASYRNLIHSERSS